MASENIKSEIEKTHEGPSNELLQQLLQRINERNKDKQRLDKLLEHIQQLEEQEKVKESKEEQLIVEETQEEDNNETKTEQESILLPIKESQNKIDQSTSKVIVAKDATTTQEQYDALWDKLKSIKPWQIWKIYSFIKTRLKFGSVEKKLKKEIFEEEMDDKYGHMSTSELNEAYKTLRQEVNDEHILKPEIYMPKKREMLEIRKRFNAIKGK